MIDPLIILVKVALSLLAILNLAILLTWVERKQSAVIQDRIGANRASIGGFRILGFFHPLADAIKLITMEDFVPPRGERFFHAVAPVTALTVALVSIAAIPFGSTLRWGERSIELVGIPLNVGVLFLFALMGLEVYGAVYGGWSSNNKYSLLGSLRASAQLVSYEIAIGASIVGIILLYGSLDLQEIVRAQKGLVLGFIPRWGIFLQPLGFIIFLTAAVAETKRIPFDLPEGESEIVGYFVEYSSMRFGMFMMTDFMMIGVVSALAATLFLGGWQVPFLNENGFNLPFDHNISLPHFMVVLLRIAAFNVKVLFLCWFLMMIRWTFPRFRYDQLMNLGWRWLFPLSLVNLLLTAFFLIL